MRTRIERRCRPSTRVIWYVDAPHELSSAATAALDRVANTSGDYIFISAITLVEIRYLVEKNRIKASVLARIEQELDETDPMIVVAPPDRTSSMLWLQYRALSCLICLTALLPPPRSRFHSARHARYGDKQADEHRCHLVKYRKPKFSSNRTQDIDH